MNRNQKNQNKKDSGVTKNKTEQQQQPPQQQQQQQEPSSPEVVDLTGMVDESIFSEVLLFANTGRIRVSPDNVRSLWKAAQELGSKELLRVTEDFSKEKGIKLCD